MSDSVGITITKQDLQELLAAAVASARQMNPLEQKKYDEELRKEERKKQMMISLARAEEEAAVMRKNGCSHTRYPANAGRQAGFPAPKGQGEWTTGGQAHSNGTISLVCLRCAHEWTWRGTPQEIEFANNEGLLGIAPPATERELKRCGYCQEEHNGITLTDHEKTCTRRPVAV